MVEDRIFSPTWYDWMYTLNACALCKQNGSSHLGCCFSCAKKLELTLNPKCQYNELTLAPYEGLLKKAIASFKYRQVPRLGVVLGTLLASILSDFQTQLYLLAQHEEKSPNEQLQSPFSWQIDIVCEVPMHWRRRLARGYNQTHILAKQVAKQCDLPYQSILKRNRHTKKQVKLEQQERLKNVSGAFVVSHPAKVRGKAILLIDDVVTTRATTTECTLALLAAGAKYVYVASLARA